MLIEGGMTVSVSLSHLLTKEVRRELKAFIGETIDKFLENG